MSNELRPTNFDTYIGQKHAMPGIKVMVQSAIQRDCAAGHMIFSGPPGLGKTTVANVIANEIGSNMLFVNAPTLTSKQRLAEELLKLDDKDILFIDEIHQLNLSVEEYLYPAVEDFTLELVVGDDTTKRTEHLPLSKFTMIGATTRIGLVSAPLRTRCQKIVRMKYYTVDELQTIVLNSAQKLGVKLSEEAARVIAKRARGTPRTANQHLHIIRDHAVVKDVEVMDQHMVSKILSNNGIDHGGLTLMDRMYLDAVMEYSRSRPVGLTTLSSVIDEEPRTIEDTIEPFLLQQGLVKKTSQGRKITEKGINHLEKSCVHLG